MPPFGLAQNGRKVPSAHRETLFDVAGHGNFGAPAGNSVVSGEHPHCPCPIVEQERPTSHGAIRVDHSPRDSHLPPEIAAGITIYSGNALSRWATRK